VAVDHEDVVLGLVGGGFLGGHGSRELALGGVVLDQVGQVVGRDDVADRDDVERGAEQALFNEGPEYQTADAAETIDSDFYSHGSVRMWWCVR